MIITVLLFSGGTIAPGEKKIFIVNFSNIILKFNK
jgi:hypothetical protein